MLETNVRRRRLSLYLKEHDVHFRWYLEEVMNRRVLIASLLSLTICFPSMAAKKASREKPQYKHGKISIPAAGADEPLRTKFSQDLALKYVENAALAWKRARNCVSCHTTGTYLQLRPAMAKTLGEPATEIRKLFVQETKKYTDKAEKHEQKYRSLMKSDVPTQITYIANGLAAWDKHTSGNTSPETVAALQLMLNVQSKDGSYSNVTCWPPFESSRYQGATVAAMALGTAPGWLKSVTDKTTLAKIAQLKKYLQTTKPAHDYERLVLLWASTRLSGLIEKERKQKILDMVLSKQRPDGGWSIRSFGTPETWGRGSRKKRLAAEENYQNPDSDGHQTGLAMIVLMDAGVSKDHEAIQAGAKWLLSNQRASGRWWTKSLNTDTYHFITYSGTVYPLLALQKCGKLEPVKAVE